MISNETVIEHLLLMMLLLSFLNGEFGVVKLRGARTFLGGAFRTEELRGPRVISR